MGGVPVVARQRRPYRGGMSTRTLAHRTVAGLAVNEWPGTGQAVVALAGLGSSGRTWAPIAQALTEARLVAPDLRGRGASQHLAGPTGLRAHARDVAAVIAELDLRDVVVIGHSMGAFLAPLVAQEAGDRVARLVLVDGGIRPALPFFMGPALTRLAFRKQLKATTREYADVQAFARKGRVGRMIASRPDLEPLVLEMLASELTGEPGRLRPQLDVDRAVADAVDCFHGSDVTPALAALTVPTHVLLASNKLKDGERPFVSDAAVGDWPARVPALQVRRLPGNHVTVLFAPEVLEAVRG